MKKYLIIFSIFGFSYLVSSYAINNVFLAQSPRVNPFYLTNLKADFVNRRDKLMLAFSSVGNVFKKRSTGSEVANEIDNNSDSKGNVAQSSNINEIPDVLFKPVSKGVSAYDKGNGEMVLRIDNKEVNVQPKEMEINGKKITVLDLTGE